jgi:hypothetical protein
MDKNILETLYYVGRLKIFENFSAPKNSEYFLLTIDGRLSPFSYHPH